MKYTVSLLLLVAIVHADQDSSTSEEDDENSAAKRTLLEGNFGMKIQPDTNNATEPSAEPEREYSRGDEEQNPASFQKYETTKVSQGYAPPKISDVLTGQGNSVPAAIAGHLFAPSPVYQARLGSPTTFEVSPTVTSQLRFARPFSAVTSRPIFPQPYFLPLDPLQSQPIYSEQRIHSAYPLVQQFPPNLYQQINDLGNQLLYSGETYQYIQNSEDDRDTNIKKNYQKAEQQNANQVQSSTIKAPSASQDQPSITSQNQNTQQAVSYARFSQGFPLSSPPPLLQYQQLPQLQQPQLFQPLPELQRSQLLQPELHVQSFLQSTPQPPLQLLPLQQFKFNDQNQQNLKTRLFPLQHQSEPSVSEQSLSSRSNQLSSPQNQENSTAQQEFQFSSQSQNEQSLSSSQPEFTLPPKLSSFNQQSVSTDQSQFPSLPQNVEESSTRPQNQQNFTTQADNLLDSEPTEEYSKFNGLNIEVSSSSQPTESSREPASVSILPKSHSTYKPTKSSEFIFTSTPTPPTLPQQRVSETSSSTLTSVSYPQPYLASVQTSVPQPIEFLPQLQSVPLSNVHTINALESSPEQQLLFVTPQPTLQPYSITFQPLPQVPGIRAVPVQRYQVQSKQEPIPVQANQQQTSQAQPASVQTTFQPTTPTPFPQQQIQLDKPGQQQQQSTQHQPSHSEQQTLTQLQQQPKSEQSQPNKEDAIVHAQQLLYDAYSPFIQPLYPETQNILIEQPQYKAAFPSNYYPVYPNYQVPDSLTTTQFFGNHAHDIFDQYIYKKKK